MQATYFTLSNFAEIFRRENYCSLVHHKRGGIEILHPSEAYILSLLDGTLSMGEVTELFGATYSISKTEAAAITSTVMRKLKYYIEPSDRINPCKRYDPQDFLFPGFEKNPNLDVPLATPQMLGLALTTQCNFKCRYCSLGAEKIAPQHMEKGLALRVINEAAALGVVHASFGGWEPLLYPDIWEIVAAITSRGMVLLFSTNGSLLDDQMVDQLAGAGLQGIQVSLDAPTAEMHHYITRSSNTFATIVAGIKKLKARGIWVKTRSVITPVNLKVVSSLIDLLVDLGVDQVTLGPQHLGSCDDHCRNSVERLDAAEAQVVQDIVREKAAQYPGSEIIYGDPEISWNSSKDMVYCGHPAMSMMIAVNGEVLPCEFIHDRHFLMGNVNDRTLKEVWLGPDHRRFLEGVLHPQHLDHACRRCDKLEDCHTGCFNLSMLTTGNYFAKDPRCPGPEVMRTGDSALSTGG